MNAKTIWKFVAMIEFAAIVAVVLLDLVISTLVIIGLMVISLPIRHEHIAVMGLKRPQSWLAIYLPETYALLQTANLVIHPNVARIVLHGSRGLAGAARQDSDIDLSLIVDLPSEPSAIERESLLTSVFETTVNAWQADTKLDRAVVFETRGCGLRCFAQTHGREDLCAIGGLNCFGLYKAQGGFGGLVTDAEVQVARMYPCLEIWRRPSL